MQRSCSRCSRLLEYYGDPPLFCAYCGQRLDLPGQAATATFDSELTHASPMVPGSATRAGLGEGYLSGPPPERIGGFRLVRLLGQGGMGAVYEAEDAELGRRVALKLIAPDAIATPEAVERFRQEGRLASTISHPRCVFVLAADEEEGRPYIVMELMPGETLQSLVERSGPLPPREAIGKVLDVVEGLIEAHQVGIIHRDVKPSNCFLEAGGRVKVGDFGLSKALGGNVQLTRTGAFVGTPLYASPEQIKGLAVDARTDVYATAATLYFLLTGRPPFREPDAAATLARIVSEPAPPVRGLRPEVPAALDATILCGLERDRECRWRDMTEFQAALMPFRPGLESSGGFGLRVVSTMVNARPFRFARRSALDAFLTLSSFQRRLSKVGRRRAPRSRRLPSLSSPYRAAIARPVGVLRAIGPFEVRGAVRWGPDQRVLLGADSTLDRPVWILLRPRGSSPLSQARRDLDRPGRPRWLKGGDQAEGRWDAFVAPLGCSLADLAGPDGLPWRDARPILLDLAQELAPACSDGTLPESLSVEQVWVQPDGSAHLVDVLAPPASTGAVPALPTTDPERALDLILRTAALALEGGRRRSHDPKAPIRAAIPEHAAQLLDRVRGAGEPFPDVPAFVTELRLDEDHPTEVSATIRLTHLGVQAIALAPGLATMFLIAFPSRTPGTLDFAILIAWPLVWVTWAVATRGGWLLRPLGLVAVRSDSRPAARWRCGLRAALAWTPATILLLASTWFRNGAGGPPWLGWLFWSAALMVVLGAVPLALASPARLPHDRLAGVWLVPR